MKKLIWRKEAVGIEKRWRDGKETEGNSKRTYVKQKELQKLNYIQLYQKLSPLEGHWC